MIDIKAGARVKYGDKHGTCTPMSPLTGCRECILCPHCRQHNISRGVACRACERKDGIEVYFKENGTP